MKKVGGTEKLMLNRGVKLDLVSMHPDVYKKDGRTVWWAFSSCTRDVKVLENDMFLGKNGKRTVFQVRWRA